LKYTLQQSGKGNDMDRCEVCGCFLQLYEVHTEAGTSIKERCNNKRCKSKRCDADPFIQDCLVNGVMKFRKSNGKDDRT